MAASFPNEIITLLPTPGPEGLASAQATFLPTTFGASPYSGDDYYPVGAITRSSWSYVPPSSGGGGWTPDPAAVCHPGSRANTAGANSGASGVIGTNNTFGRVSFWINRLDRVGTTLGDPPEIAVSVRAGFGYLSQEIWTGRIIAEAFGAPTGDTLIVAIDNLPLCTQLEIWALVVPPEGTAPEDVQQVSMRVGVIVDRGGGGPIDVKMGTWVVGGSTP